MRRVALTTALLTSAALLVGVPAFAHVEPTSTEVAAGSQATVEFTVEHGCDGSPTVKVEFQVPDEITDAAPVDKEGWTTSSSDGVVTYEGGSLPADQEDTFAVTFTAPDTVGATLAFPFVQTCTQGSIDWIQTGEEPERPAPLVTIGDPDPSAAQTTTTTDASSSTTEATTTTVDASAVTSSTVVGTADADDDSGSGSAVFIIGVVIVTIGAVSFAIWQRRRSDS